MNVSQYLGYSTPVALLRISHVVCPIVTVPFSDRMTHCAIFSPSADPGTVSCGRLRNPDLGNVDHDSSVPGAVATYLCALGYVLVGGVRERRCLDNGTWDGNEPTCDGMARL